MIAPSTHATSECRRSSGAGRADAAEEAGAGGEEAEAAAEHALVKVGMAVGMAVGVEAAVDTAISVVWAVCECGWEAAARWPSTGLAPSAAASAPNVSSSTCCQFARWSSLSSDGCSWYTATQMCLPPVQR
eukprot:4727705-Pleurochrysis_carterae.AAC.4